MFRGIYDLFVVIFGSKKPVKVELPVVAEPLPPTPEEEQKKLGFVFPETLLAYKAEKARFEEEIGRTAVAYRAVWNSESRHVPLTDVAEELKRRRYQKERDDQIRQYERTLRKLHDEEDELARAFQVKERARYLDEGTEIFRTPWKLCKDSYRYEDCRVVVKWREKFILLSLSRSSTLAAPYGTEDSKRTGEYEPTTIDWLTESISQFSNDELGAIARFQDSAATE